MSTLSMRLKQRARMLAAGRCYSPLPWPSCPASLRQGLAAACCSSRRGGGGGSTRKTFHGAYPVGVRGTRAWAYTSPLASAKASGSNNSHPVF
jgi:hypothetical protein